jgi:hypothetical protein
MASRPITVIAMGSGIFRRTRLGASVVAIAPEARL